MSQRQQLERIMAIDQSIRNGEYPNADRLAEKLEVSRRVIFNDREFMINRLGAPMEYDRQHGGWFYTNKTWVLPGIIVSEGELLAFFLSVEISKRFLGSSLESPLRSAVEKISKGVKGAVTVDLDSLRSNYTFSNPALISNYETVLLDLEHAIAHQQCIWMRYFTAGRAEYTERKVMPYHMHNYRGDWFLIGYDTLRNDFRIFLVGRIEKWRVLSEKFKRNETFNASEWIGNAFQLHGGSEVEDVSIWFSQQRAQFIRERQWHASQRIEEKPDGSLVLHMRTGGLVEVRNWVLQFGRGAKVLAPESLRMDCMTEIEKMSNMYENKEWVT
jgi:predicted DNA-binding transcriptional regulator YafY